MCGWVLICFRLMHCVKVWCSSTAWNYREKQPGETGRQHPNRGKLTPQRRRRGGHGEDNRGRTTEGGRPKKSWWGDIRDGNMILSLNELNKQHRGQRTETGLSLSSVLRDNRLRHVLPLLHCWQQDRHRHRHRALHSLCLFEWTSALTGLTGVASPASGLGCISLKGTSRPTSLQWSNTSQHDNYGLYKNIFTFINYIFRFIFTFIFILTVSVWYNMMNSSNATQAKLN